MPKKRKPIPPGQSLTPKRNVAVIEARRALVRELLLSGMDQRLTNNEILAALAEKGYRIDVSTLIEDKKAVDEEVIRHYGAERERMVARAVAKFHRHAAMLEETATDAKDAGEYTARVRALKAADEALMAALKTAGLLVDRQEVAGQVTNVNLNAEMTPEEKLKAVKAALRKARIDEDGKPLK